MISPTASTSLRLAVYGKGGIGKSTLSSNLSAALGMSGKSVLQIGCDPKQDSTRLLLQGQPLPTVLEYLRQTRPEARRLEDILRQGYGGVSCVEAGGPEPGLGCAGRGILSTFELLEDLGLHQLAFDITLYDVLGDVVCGGFAVPLRERYADQVFIVTSGEFMALYAANNILRGVRHFESQGHRVGGILLNRRGLEDETERVQRFADAVHLPVLLDMPRDSRFQTAEKQGVTVLEAFPDSDISRAFLNMAGALAAGLPSHRACPLAPEALESTVLGRTLPSPLQVQCSVPETKRPEKVDHVQQKSGAVCAFLEQISETGPPALQGRAVLPRRYWSKSMRRQEVLHGCAYNGAVHTTLQIADAHTLVHGPISCAFISHSGACASARRSFQRSGHVAQAHLEPRLFCTEMDEDASIFGGAKALETSLERALKGGPQALFIVSTCSSGIIGDDLDAIASSWPHADGGPAILKFKTDGNLTGDYMQGILDSMALIAERFIDPSIKPEGPWVNIVGEKNLAANTDGNYQRISDLLKRLELKVNCRFIRETRLQDIAGFKRARLCLLACEDAMGRALRTLLEDRFQAEFLEGAFPLGFHATCQWLRRLGRVFDREALAERIIEEESASYQSEMARLRERLAGKRLMVVTPNHAIDWVLECALDLGMEILRVGIFESSWEDQLHTGFADIVPIQTGYRREDRDREVLELKPDLVLSNTLWPDQPVWLRIEQIPYLPDVGFYSGLALARRMHTAMLLPVREGWRDDL